MIFVMYAILGMCATAALITFIWVAMKPEKCEIVVTEGDNMIRVSTRLPANVGDRADFEVKLATKMRQELLRR